MARPKKEYNLYKPDTKERFLGEYPDATALSYKRIFDKSSKYEHKYNIDLYDFNIEEIENLLYQLNPSTAGAAHTYGRQITAYIDFAIEEGIREQSINPLKLKRPEYFSKFVDEDKNLFITEEELRLVENELENPQDAVVLRLIFEGVMGKACNHLCNLSKNDVNFSNNTLTLRNNDSSVYGEWIVSDRCIQLIDEAINQEDYAINNGEAPDNPRIKPVRKLADNQYVIRSTNTNLKNESVQVNKSVIYNRVKVASEFLGHLAEDVKGLHYMTAKNLYRSGILKFAKDLYEKNGKLDLDELKIISKKFDISNIHLLRSFVSMDVLNNLYDIQK